MRSGARSRCYTGSCAPRERAGGADCDAPNRARRLLRHGVGRARVGHRLLRRLGEVGTGVPRALLRPGVRGSGLLEIACLLDVESDAGDLDAALLEVRIPRLVPAILLAFLGIARLALEVVEVDRKVPVSGHVASQLDGERS